MSDKQLKNLDDIQRFYADYYNQLEQLWFDFETSRLTEEQATKRFFEYKKSETDINPIISETIRNKPKRIVDKCKLHSDEYFKQVFNT
jgi:RimJ/RimL family protein N-acetyltransferase